MSPAPLGQGGGILRKVLLQCRDKVSKLQFLIQTYQIFFSAVNFFQRFVIKTLDPDWYSA
jgi:hypothetical protein